MKVAQCATLHPIGKPDPIWRSLSFVIGNITNDYIALTRPILLIHSLIMYNMATSNVLINKFARNINSKPCIITSVFSWSWVTHGHSPDRFGLEHRHSQDLKNLTYSL